MTLTVFLSGPYVGKNRRLAFGGRLRLSAEARMWMQAMADMVAVECRRQCWCDAGGPLALTVWHTNARLDVDAPIPLVMDAVAAGLGINDRRFVKVTALRASIEALGGMGVKIEVDDDVPV